MRFIVWRSLIYVASFMKKQTTGITKRKIYSIERWIQCIRETFPLHWDEIIRNNDYDSSFLKLPFIAWIFQQNRNLCGGSQRPEAGNQPWTKCHQSEEQSI